MTHFLQWPHEIGSVTAERAGQGEVGGCTQRCRQHGRLWAPLWKCLGWLWVGHCCPPMHKRPICKAAYFLLLSLVRHLTSVSRGQRSRSYLLSCNERLEEHLHELFWAETNSQPWLKHTEQNRVINYNLEAYLLKLIKYARDLWSILTGGKTSSRHV